MPPHVVFQRRLRQAARLAERLAPTILADLTYLPIGIAGQPIDGALDQVYAVLFDANPADDEDERHGAELAATQHAAYVLGLAIGRSTPLLRGADLEVTHG